MYSRMCARTIEVKDQYFGFALIKRSNRSDENTVDGFTVCDRFTIEFGLKECRRTTLVRT